jgi:hypothetical protein
MLSEKKISSKGNGNNDSDYFGDLSKSFTNMYDNLQNNKSEKSIKQQMNNFAESTTDFLGNTFNLNSDPFANPNPVPSSPVIQQNVTEIPNILSQGPKLTPEGPSLIPQGSQILSQGIGEMQKVSPSSAPLETTSKSFMDMIEEPSKTFSNVFSSESAKSSSEKVFEAPTDYSTLETIVTIILLFLFLVLISIYAIQYFYGIDIVAKIKGIFTNHPEIEIKVEQESEKKDTIDNDVSQILKKPQVFNIPENNYIYGDAQAVCKAYGARLASYEEIEEAYNKGAEWCNYGWSDGQMVLFPTQQKTFDELQKIEGHENDCGRPGINGGFIDNPKLKYGVNCYGYKPRINKIEKEMMETTSIYPKTEKDIAIDKRVEYWKERLSEIIVSPFNHEKWSKV